MSGMWQAVSRLRGWGCGYAQLLGSPLFLEFETGSETILFAGRICIISAPLMTSMVEEKYSEPEPRYLIFPFTS